MVLIENYRVIRSYGGEFKAVASRMTYEEAVLYCEDHGWMYEDESGHLWDLFIEPMF